METEKDPKASDDKRAYRSPQLAQFGSVSNITRVQEPADPFTDNVMTGAMGPSGPGTPMGFS